MNKMDDLTAAMESTLRLIRNKTEKLRTVARLKLELAEQRSKLKKYYMALGKLTYRRARGIEDTVDLEALMTDIDTLRDGIEAIRYLLAVTCKTRSDCECGCCETAEAAVEKAEGAADADDIEF